MSDLDFEKMHKYVVLYINAEIEMSTLWKLISKDYLEMLFSTNSGFKAEDEFFKLATNLIELRSKNDEYELNGVPKQGQWLFYDPNSSMRDGLAEDESSGFFDSHDIPPPEFWVRVHNRELIAFIPGKFLEIANKGMEFCIGDCLTWGTVVSKSASNNNQHH